MHSAQGITIGNDTQHGICWAVLSDRASRAMAYVGMTRGRDENHLAIYPAVTNEAHVHHGDDTGIHQLRRGTRPAAAHWLHHIVTSNDDRARTMHTVAARTDRESLPDRVASLLDRNDHRLARRAQAWHQYAAQTDAREAALQRLSATRHEDVARERSRSWNRGYGLEL